MNKANHLTSNKEKYDLYRPKKFLGQNFLVDENIARKIVASLDITEEDTIIEIGPGQGALTKFISQVSDKFFAVELDKHIYEKLLIQYGNKINLIHKDFLQFDFEKDLSSNGGKVKVIGNIPYNITTEILFKLFEQKDRVFSAVLMMQKEVAQRLVSKQDTKDYGILAVFTQLYTSPKILFNVPPTAFFPKPKVNSAIVKFEFNKENFNIADKELFKTIVKDSFGQRRKTMRNSLKRNFERNNVSFENIDFDFSRRPENVSIEEFANLANEVSSMM